MGKFEGIQYIKDQCFMDLPELSSFAQDLSGKTIIVIGANIGLGLATAKHFASLKPSRLILGCRSKEKGDAAVKEIQQGIDSSETTVENWEIDLEKNKMISDFADRFEREANGQLDILIMNAGLNTICHTSTESGWEKSIQVNHLGTALLTLLLLPYMKNAPYSPPTPRIVVVGSETHYFVTFKKQARKPNIIEALNEETSSGAMSERYYYTKLLNLFFARSLAARLPSPSAENRNPVVTVVNPGWCKTELMRDQQTTLKGRVIRVFSLFMCRTAEEGGRVILWAALSHLDNELHGRYSTSFRIEEESDYSLTPQGREAEKRTWDETISILEKVDPRVKTIVQEQLTNPSS
ncbi:hypothetical protein Clacol_002334 [Clathrus columnatus]|uniref:NAD(P)-binding protein n=1 Tax=Clathrus columnatus TaxID=1419009 RepID=A0AAV5A524_9AGAM|nr:hypothetical protein Clacol_002334 [Clathrus columnatus]